MSILEYVHVLLDLYLADGSTVLRKFSFSLVFDIQGHLARCKRRCSLDKRPITSENAHRVSAYQYLPQRRRCCGPYSGELPPHWSVSRTGNEIVARSRTGEPNCWLEIDLEWVRCPSLS